MKPKDGKAEFSPDFHWPHAADACKAYLDLNALEPLAVRVLARGLLSQRLVAFVGAGISAAYGRQTWSGLMEGLWEIAAEAHKDKVERGWSQICERLWPSGLPDFLGYSDHAIKAQILSDMLKLLPGEERSDLKGETKKILEDFHGFIAWVCERWSNNPKDVVSRLMATEWEEEARKKSPPSESGLLAVLNVLASRQSFEYAELYKILVNILTHQGVGGDSPLRLLIDEWGVRRFITTNYDKEIERGFRSMGFGQLDPAHGPGHTGHYASIDCDRENVGGALRFALEGPRRHAEVLHLHGDVADARSLIVTESDYQRLYLDEHPRRDLVTNATLANFGANPLLFVGSDISEDDVLRPMRQFMSGEGHRSDRMAVALFVSANKAHERAQRQANLWLRYGVYTLDLGRASFRNQEVHYWGKASKEPWLVGLLQAQRQLRSAKHKERKCIANKLQRTRAPDAIEGVMLTPGQVTQIKQALTNLADEVRKSGSGLRAQTLFDITASWLSSLFVCAKLIDLRRRAREVIEEDSTLARPYESLPIICNGLTTWNGVMLDHPIFGGRFARIPEGVLRRVGASDPFDENLDQLCEFIRTHPGLSDATYRRVVLVCAARGSGKGAQFDRLIEAGKDTSGADCWPRLSRLLDALGGYQASAVCHSPVTWRVAHINLSFSNELGPILDQVLGVMESMQSGRDPGTKGRTHDQLERLSRALKDLSISGGKRLLIVLGNAGVLFDAEGRAKNGQICRVMRALLSPRFAKARIDILMYVGESQMPEHQRMPPDIGSKATSRGLLEICENDEAHRRLFRLNIVAGRRPGTKIHVFPLRHTRVLTLAGAYFPELVERISDLYPDGKVADALALRLYFAAGGSRLAHTLLLAWLEASINLQEAAPFKQQTDPRALVDHACSHLRAAPAASAVEACVEFVLDQWAVWHQRRCTFLASNRTLGDGAPEAWSTLWAKFSSQLTPEAWKLQVEILWHLSAFSHPVEVNVLMACRRVAQAANACEAGDPQQCILIALELLVHRCLVFRIEKRPIEGLPTASAEEPVLSDHHRVRYTLHRHIQRHFLRIMGGRNLDSTSWDPYTTTLYASLPDEVPVLPTDAHATLVEVLQDLTDYPREGTQGKVAVPATNDDVRELVQRADRIRAAYYLARSSYSLGVVSHLTTQAANGVGRLGHLELYRRLVRWITHAARYWERRENESVFMGLKSPAIFHPGELVWLYNECGVISLAQGKLHDAEQALGMAEAAVRRIEHDDTGSLHTRIRLHSALVQIERGRPHRARQMLLPISQRHGGHRVPPLLALFYLGQIDHLGGSYHSAIGNYERALAGLREVGRSRAAAFVLMNLADVRHSLHKQVAANATVTSPERQAWIEADEAISLAQQGGHEDLRVMAILGRVRLCIDAGRLEGQNLFEHIEFAQRYAILMDLPRVACDAHELRARLLMRQGEYRLSATDATMSLEIAAKYDLKLKKARGLLTLSEVLLNRGEQESARTLVAMGREIAVSADYYACVRGFKDLELRLFEASRKGG